MAKRVAARPSQPLPRIAAASAATASDPRPRDQEGGARAERRRDHAADEEAEPGIAAADDSSTLITRACMPALVSSCTALTIATHWTPLPAPPSAEAAQATRQGRGGGHAEVADADRQRC